MLVGRCITSLQLLLGGYRGPWGSSSWEPVSPLLDDPEMSDSVTLTFMFRGLMDTEWS